METPVTFLFLGFGTAVMLCGMRFLNPLLSNPAGRLLVRMGDWSYATYLIHPVVIVVFIGTGLTWKYGPAMGPTTMLILYGAVTLVVSGIYYRFVEVPLLRHGRRMVGL